MAAGNTSDAAAAERDVTNKTMHVIGRLLVTMADLDNKVTRIPTRMLTRMLTRILNLILTSIYRRRLGCAPG